MLLPYLIIIPFIGGIISWMSEKINEKYPKLIAIIFNILTLVILYISTLSYMSKHNIYKYSVINIWIEEFKIPWSKYFGISIHLAVDNLSGMMILLTSILGIISILCSWNEIKKRQGFFYFNIMSIISFTIGIFLSIDLFIFFCFWELIILPIYFIISIWGVSLYDQKKSLESANRFIVFSQISSLIMLLTILGLVLNCYKKSHIWSFDYNVLLHIPLSFNLEYLLMLGLFISFAIKIPIFPFHIWLPKIHAYSPVFASVDLSGFLLKTGVYGILRFCIPLFPNVLSDFTTIVFFIGLLTIFYPAIIAFSETNIKKIIAYTSISHMGIILIGIYTNNELSYKGAIFQMLSNGLSIAGLFVLSSQIYLKFGTYNLKKIRGFYNKISILPGFLLFFVMSNIGIPGTSNFIGEFLILLGTFEKYPILAIICSIGLIITTIYFMNIIQYTHYGKSIIKKSIYKKVSFINLLIMSFLTILIVIIGIYPKIILNWF